MLSTSEVQARKEVLQLLEAKMADEVEMPCEATSLSMNKNYFISLGYDAVSVRRITYKDTPSVAYVRISVKKVHGEK